MIINVISLIISVFSVNVCDCKKYTNYTLYRAIPVNKSHIDFFTSLDEIYDINYWRSPGLLYRAVDFVINPKDQTLFLRDAERHGVYLTTIIGDIQSAFDKQTVKSYIRRQMDSFGWNDYYRLNDIYQWLKDLQNKFPKIVTLQSIGQSYDKRNIMAARISLKADNVERPRVIVEGGIHAREWISPAFVTYFINQILYANKSNDQLLKEIANSYVWYFVPVLNVDGYEYTHTDDRLWRKNRHGAGVDLNRNFGYAFGSTGISWTPQSDLYCGKEAFSEKETKAMADFITSKSKNLLYYVAFHSYGQYLILPYANSKEHVENFGEMYDICKKVAQRIASRYRTKYEIGTAFDTVGYVSSGVSGCWVKNTFKVPHVVIFELRDNGYDGFALAPEKILPTCKETMDGLLELFNPYKGKMLNSNGFKEFSYKTTMQKMMFVTVCVLFYYIDF